MSKGCGLIWFAAAALLIGSCHQKSNSPSKPAAAKHTIGNQLTLLEFRMGNIWGSGYAVRVFPDEYLVLEHKNCPGAKRDVGDHPDPNGEGICVIRLNQQQSDRFEMAMRPYRRYATPLSLFSLEDPDRRPDGKPCRDRVTDSDLISLIWTSTEGSQIATFYDGCDPKEYAAFYKSLHHVSDTLPIQGILAKR